MPTVYYRTEDPVENLKLRVVVREVARTRNYNEDGSQIVPFYNETILSWQQKLYSPAEIADYLQNKNQKGGNVVQYEARRHLARLEQAGHTIKDMLEEEMLYTYVDKDHFAHDRPPPLHDTNSQEPYLGAAVRTLGSDFNGNERQKDITQRVFGGKPFKSMHICLATDVDVSALRTKVVWEPREYYVENVICSIKIYQDGMLEVSPAFSSIVEENAAPSGSEATLPGAALAAFLDDQTAEASFKRGLRLATFRVRSIKSGTEYEYVIQNVNDLLAPYKIEEIDAQRNAQNTIKAAENRNLKNAANWKQDPSSRDKTVAIYAELLSARGFVGDQLYINYEMTVPPNWLLRSGDLSDGNKNTTDREVGTGSNLGNVGKSGFTAAASVPHIDLHKHAGVSAFGGAAYSGEGDGAGGVGEEGGIGTMKAATAYEVAASEGMLQGTTHIAKTSEGIRGSLMLPFHRPHWGGIHLGFSGSLITRIVVGSVFFLSSVTAAIVGVSFALWVIPGLAILFVLGTGYPGSQTQVVLVQNSTKMSEQRRGGSTSKRVFHPSIPKNEELVGDSLVSPRAVFNHLMSFSFDVRDLPDSEMFSTVAPSAHLPTMFLQVYSVNRLGRHRLEGYGYHHFSDQPGSVEVEIKTWKPVGSTREKMRDFFLGSSLRLKSDAFVENMDKSSSALNRFGLLTESAGSIRIRSQSIVTDPRLIEMMLVQQKEAVKQHLESSAKVRRTVDDILKSFKLGGGSSTLNTPGRNTPSRQGSFLSGFSTPNASGSAASTPLKSRSSRIIAAAGGPSATAKMTPAEIISQLNETAKANKVAEILARARAKSAGAAAKKTAALGSASGNAGTVSSTAIAAAGGASVAASGAASPVRSKSPSGTVIPKNPAGGGLRAVGSRDSLGIAEAAASTGTDISKKEFGQPQLDTGGSSSEGKRFDLGSPYDPHIQKNPQRGAVINTPGGPGPVTSSILATPVATGRSAHAAAPSSGGRAARRYGRSTEDEDVGAGSDGVRAGPVAEDGNRGDDTDGEDAPLLSNP